MELDDESLPVAESLQQEDWKQIEDISSFQRRLGAVMMEQGAKLFDDFNSGARTEETQSVSDFDENLWLLIAGLVAPQMLHFKKIWAGIPKKGLDSKKKLSRKDQVKEGLRKEQAKRLSDKCLACLKEGSVPPRPAVCPVTHLLALQCLAEYCVATERPDAIQTLLDLQSWGSQAGLPSQVKDAVERHLLVLWRSRCSPSEEEMWALPVLWRKFLGTPARLPAETQRQSHISLYPDQVEFAQAVLEGLRPQEAGPCVVCYRTPPSGGKTTAAALLGVLLQRQSLRRDATKQWLVYACYSNAVRIDVARMLLAADVPFAMISAGSVSPSFRCYHGRPPRRPRYEGPSSVSQRLLFGMQRLVPLCDREPVAWICDLVSAQALMRLAPGHHVLMVDEPTAAFSDTLAQAQLLLVRQKPLVLCLVSATLPALDSMPHLVRCLEPGRVIDVVASRSTASCWASVGPTHQFCAPHCVLSPADLVESSSRRWLVYYCPEALIHLSKSYPLAWAKTWKPQDLLTWTTATCQALAWKVLLEAAATGEVSAFSVDFQEDKLEDLGAAISTQASWALRGSTLWLMPSGSTLWLEQTHERLLGNQGPECLKRAERTRQSHLVSMKEIEKQSKVHTEKRREEGRERSSALDRAREEELPVSLCAELWSHWPSQYVVNSREHQRKHGVGGTITAPMQTPPVPDEVACGSEAIHAACLLCGVGSLDEETDQAYNSFVQDALRSQQLSVIMLPWHLLFGLNFPVDRVVLPSSTLSLSVSETQQAAGRAGRTGSASGHVVFASADQARAVFLGIPQGSECSLERLAAKLEATRE